MLHKTTLTFRGLQCTLARLGITTRQVVHASGVREPAGKVATGVSGCKHGAGRIGVGTHLSPKGGAHE